LAIILHRAGTPTARVTFAQEALACRDFAFEIKNYRFKIKWLGDDLRLENKCR